MLSCYCIGTAAILCAMWLDVFLRRRSWLKAVSSPLKPRRKLEPLLNPPLVLSGGADDWINGFKYCAGDYPFFVTSASCMLGPLREDD